MKEKINIDLHEFCRFVDRLNSGHDRSIVFGYMEDFLKEKKKIELDIEKYISDEDE